MWVKNEYEFDIREDCWGGAADRIKDMPDEYIDRLEDMMNIPEFWGEETPTDTKVNDFIWFDDDTYADWFGFADADQMWRYFELLEDYDAGDIYWDELDEEFTTYDMLQEAFELYQRENPDWEEDYADLDEFIEDRYTQFEAP